MAGKTFHIEVVTPRRIVFQGEALAVTLPGVVSPFQVLVNHAPLLTELEVGDLKIVDEKEHEHHFATSGGFAEVKNNVLTVIAETVESAEEIDVHRAERSRSRAETRIKEARATHDRTVDMVRAEAALARSMNRLKVAGR